MSILSYFKSKDGLPDPMGPLSAAIPSQAIALANREVEKVISEEASRRPNKPWKVGSVLYTYSNGVPILSIVSFSHAHQYLTNRSVPLSFVHVVPFYFWKIFRAFNFRTVAYGTKIFSHEN